MWQSCPKNQKLIWRKKRTKSLLLSFRRFLAFFETTFFHIAQCSGVLFKAGLFFTFEASFSCLRPHFHVEMDKSVERGSKRHPIWLGYSLPRQIFFHLFRGQKSFAPPAFPKGGTHGLQVSVFLSNTWRFLSNKMPQDFQVAFGFSEGNSQQIRQ